MRKLILAFTLCAILSSFKVSAYELLDGLTLKGFGTFNVIYNSIHEADYVENYYTQGTGAGKSSDFNWKAASKAGLQLDWNPNDRIGFTVQGVTQQLSNGSWAPQLEWGFVKFQPTSKFSVRIGRLRPSTYMLSEYQNVNYVHPWVRPPAEFYTPMMPFSNVNGIDMIWKAAIRDVNLLIQPFYGNGSYNFILGTKVDTHHLAGVNLVATYDNFMLQLGASNHFNNTNNALLGQAFLALDVICTLEDKSACSNHNALNSQNKRITVFSVGANWDNEDYFVTGEFATRSTESFIANVSSFYVSAGTRIGKWTPYILFSHLQNDGSTSFHGGTFQGIAELGFPSTNAIVSNILQTNPMDQDTYALGIRYDVLPNVDLKLQWDHIETTTQSGQPGTGGGLFSQVNNSAQFRDRDNSVDLINLSVDFIF